jgi:pyridoxamine 5'-phosphate oxidase
VCIVDLNYPDPTWQHYRQLVWQQLSPAARQQFTWPAPGAVRPTLDPFPEVAIPAEHPIATFCLLLLQPVWVEHLELRGTPQNRWQYVLQALGENASLEWQRQALNP